MTASKKANEFIQETSAEEYNNPLDISEILQVCAEYNQLGWEIQSQIHLLLDNQLADFTFDKSSLPKIKSFLTKIADNFYFGDASEQAKECLEEIKMMENKDIKFSATTLNN